MRWKTALFWTLLQSPDGCEPKQGAAPEDAAPSPVAHSGAAPGAASRPGALANAIGSGLTRDEQGSGAIGCRAVSADGEVTASPEGEAGPVVSLTAQGEIPNDQWLLLATKSRVVAKDPRTTRETTFLGPARVRPCVGRREESWIAQGTFESAPGAGEAPGSEEWVTTPHGVLRYVAAKLRVSVLPKETTVKLGSGVAFFWAADDVRTVRLDKPDSRGRADAAPDDEPWQRLNEGTLRAVMRTGGPLVGAARSSVGACSVVALRSEDLARALLSGEKADASDLGRSVADQITARLIARASCSVAGLRVAALTALETRTELSRMVERANARWSNLPDAR